MYRNCNLYIRFRSWPESLVHGVGVRKKQRCRRELGGLVEIPTLNLEHLTRGNSSLKNITSFEGVQCSCWIPKQNSLPPPYHGYFHIYIYMRSTTVVRVRARRPQSQIPRGLQLAHTRNQMNTYTASLQLIDLMGENTRRPILKLNRVWPGLSNAYAAMPNPINVACTILHDQARVPNTNPPPPMNPAPNIYMHTMRV